MPGSSLTAVSVRMTMASIAMLMVMVLYRTISDLVRSMRQMAIFDVLNPLLESPVFLILLVKSRQRIPVAEGAYFNSLVLL